MRRSIVVLAAGVSALLVAAGCGRGQDRPAPTAQAEREIRALFAEYTHAVARRDYGRACSLFTAKLVAQQVATGAPSCAAALHRSAGDGLHNPYVDPEPDGADFLDARILEIAQVDERSASLTVDRPSGEYRLAVRRAGRAWRLAQHMGIGIQLDVPPARGTAGTPALPS